MRRSSRIRADEVETLAKFSCCLFFLLAMTASSAWSADAAPKNVGFVLDVSGQCFLNGFRRPLEVGQRLPVGATLHFPSHYKSTDYVVIALRDGSQRSVDCSEPHQCDSPIRLPGTTEGNAIMQTILDSLLPQERQYVVPISRGIGPPPEMVLKLADGEVDLEPLFGAVPAGVYELTLDPISTSAEPTASSPITLFVSWGPNHPSRVAVPSLRPGLFEASVPTLQLDEVWVLVAPSVDYIPDASDLEDAARLARGWHISSVNFHGFLRTYLASLASKATSANR